MTRSRAGWPSHVPTDDARNLVESLSGFGIPQDEIARLVGDRPHDAALRLYRFASGMSPSDQRSAPIRIMRSCITAPTLALLAWTFFMSALALTAA